MSFVEEFEASLISLSNTLQKKYALLRNLDRSVTEIQRQNEQRCEQEIEDIVRGVRDGKIRAEDASLVKFSDEVIEEQKHSTRIADEKVALAIQAYDLVDAHIQQLDQYLKKADEEKRREKVNIATNAIHDPSTDNGAKLGRSSETGRGGRKKTRHSASASASAATIAATEAAAATAAGGHPIGMDLDIPVDPNEPTYCFCNQVSYGEMVACDNANCKIEWFHFGCVGLKEQPKGKWYCSDCVAVKKQKKRR